MEIMKFIKKNLFTIIAIIVFLLLVVLLIQVKNIFFPDEGSAIYGNRLEGIEKVKINDSKKKKIKEAVTSDGIASKATVRISGKIIDVNIVVNMEASYDSAKGIANKVLENLSDEEKKYYDIQVFINKEEKTDNFPIIGYKHHAKEAFSWTKDR